MTTKAIRKAAGFVIYRKNCDEVIEYLLMQASYANYHWTPPKGMIHGYISIGYFFIIISQSSSLPCKIFYHPMIHCLVLIVT